jgi:hypothetical protein
MKLWVPGHELAGGDKRHKAYPTNVICKEAFDRLTELEYDDQTEIFRFRMTGPHRLYGFRFGHVFKTVWFDPVHMIYPTPKQDKDKVRLKQRRKENAKARAKA